MSKRIIVIPKNDLVLYPPTISLLRVLSRLGYNVECVGWYSDDNGRRRLEKEGVKFFPVYRKMKDESKIRVINWAFIIWRLYKYKKNVKDYLRNANIQSDDIIWFIHSDSIGVLQKYIEKNKYVVQFYEFENYNLTGLGKLLHPNYDAWRYMHKAKALVHCEYNRAMISNGLYGIKNSPIVLPNKPYEDANENTDMPEDIKRTIKDIKCKIKGRRAIIYQGIFEPNERRLDEFCESIRLLPEDIILICMGGGLGRYYDIIRAKYECDRILFVPFIRPPYHLLITKMAKYGVLAYFPTNTKYAGVINPLYCAPNKIFEYGKFGIPMIANDCPGLKLIFEEFKCGKTISMPITAERIADTIVHMESDYITMSKGARAYYDSVDIEQIIERIIKSC